MSDPTRERSDARLLDALLGPLADALREVNLPLHILLENRFGDLNENQVEFVEAARIGAERADTMLRQVQRIRALEARPLTAHTGDWRPIDLLRAALTIASAREAARGVRFESDVSPALPRVRGDRAMLEEAFTLLLTAASAAAPDGATVRVEAHGRDAAVEVSIHHGVTRLPWSLDRVLAGRLLEASGASLPDPQAGVLGVSLMLAPQPGA